ncbi:flagellar basal-body MS-ring/collar protein FliF [Natronospora cellulosivora (SeqCode)]
MSEFLKPYIDQFKEQWSKINSTGRWIIVLITALVFLALTYIIFVSGSSQYQVLFSNLDPRDADTIIQRLEDTNASYRLEDDGRTIMLPSDMVHRTRLDMAGQGLPSQGVVGFEIFDQSSFGTTDFERRVNYYRAISGELSRSIQAMDSVDYARVQITAPRESIFLENEQEAEASVLLRLAPGRNLNEAQIRAISNLVAGSVQGMSENKVTIVDTAGNLLSAVLQAGSNDPYNTMRMNRFDIEREFAEALRQDLRLLLSRILGPDNFTIQVQAKLNFDQREVESREFSPVVGDEGIARSRQEEYEYYEGNDGALGGVPGTENNLPQYQYLDEDGSQSQFERSDTITNYEINERIERRVYAPGELERISVAVVLNQDDPNLDLTGIEEIVRAAIGYEQSRGDLVTVSNLVFDRSLEEEIARAEAASLEAERSSMYLYSALIALTLIVLLILFIFIKRSVDPVSEEVIPGKAIDFTVDEDLEKEVAASNGLTEEEKARIQLRENIAKTVGEKPEDVAQLLKTWLTED